MDAHTQEKWNETYMRRKIVSTVDFAKKALSFLEIQPGATILDIGCGDGRDSMFFAQKGLHVTAIDFSEVAIAKLQKHSPSITAIVKDIATMDFPHATFDAVYAHLSLHYFDDKKTTAIFQKVYDLLRDNGFFFVRCKSIHDPLYKKGQKIEEDMFLFEHARHFFSVSYMKDKLHNFDILSLDETTASYDGKRSCFVEAVARKKSAI